MQDLFKPIVDKVKINPEEMDPTEFHYDAEELFTKPLLVRGTKKQFVPNPSIKKMSVLDETTTEQVLNTLKHIEEMEHIYLASIADLNLTLLPEQGFLFPYKGPNNETFNLFIPFETEAFNTVSFKRLSNLLDIPYKFSQKNPSNLNFTNFDYWREKICDEKKKNIPICIVFSKDKKADVTIEGVETPCHLVYTLFQTSSVTNVDGSAGSLLRTLDTQIPVLHKMTPVFMNTMKKILPNSKYILHSCEFGFEQTKKSKGDHFLKFIVDDPSLKIKIKNGEKEEEFLPTISLRSNFTGETKDFGYVNVSLQMLRLVCSNGLMLPIPESYLQSMQDAFVQRLASVNKIDPSSKGYVKTLEKYKMKFKKLFSGTVCKIPLPEFMSSFETSSFIDLFKAFLSSLSSGELLKETEELQVKLANVLDEDFVEAVEKTAKATKIPGSVSKAVILEYLAQKESSEIIFQNAQSIVNYVSYIGQSFPVRVQQTLEQNVVKFGKGLVTSLIHKKNDKMERLSKYTAMLGRV